MSADAIDAMGSVTASRPQGTPNPAASATGESRGALTFGDFLDVINPLQHIPIVSTIYRRITGDAIDPEARLVGGALYGGVVGFAASLANVIVEEQTGKDIGDTISAALLGGGTDGEGEPATAVRTADIAWSAPANGGQTGIDGRYRATPAAAAEERIAWFGPRIAGRVEIAALNETAQAIPAAGATTGTDGAAAANPQKAAAAYRKPDDFAYMDERFDR